MKDKYQIFISSPPDREKLVAEIFFDDLQWAEVNQEHDILEVEFYPHPDEQVWRIDFPTAIRALTEAKKMLKNE
jgi:hypothetical protein